jgi:HD superfamily phosphohydrolase YqeK
MMVTPIRDFIQPADAQRAGREFPGVKPAAAPTVEQLNQTIADDVDALSKALAQFK